MQGHEYLIFMKSFWATRHSGFLCVFVFQGLDFSNSAELREEDLSLTAGVADISTLEVIIIHSQSQYCCVVKTRTILTSIHLSCRGSHISTSVGQ